MPELPPIDANSLDNALRRFAREREEAAGGFSEEILSGTSGGSKRDSRSPLRMTSQPLPVGRALPTAQAPDPDWLARAIALNNRAHALPKGIIGDVQAGFASFWRWLLDLFAGVRQRIFPSPARGTLPRARPILAPSGR